MTTTATPTLSPPSPTPTPEDLVRAREARQEGHKAVLKAREELKRLERQYQLLWDVERRIWTQVHEEHRRQTKWQVYTKAQEERDREKYGE
jgi:hypothetical protein